MKYFIDTEFIEGFHKPLFGKRRHFIDLISIAIVCEDGRSYYAISNEFNPKDADQWVKDNVISKLPRRRVDLYDSPRERQESLLWKSNHRIANDIFDFIKVKDEVHRVLNVENPTAEFYAYYADYDWVVFCSLFGRMIDLPKGFPMYCRDLKQILDNKMEDYIKSGYADWSDYNNGKSKLITHSFEECMKRLKSCKQYPKQQNKHSALDDAKWNFELYKFLKE